MISLPDELWQYIIEFTECNQRWYHVVRDNKRRQKNITKNEKEIGWLLQHVQKCRARLGSDIREANELSYQCLKSDKNHVCFACSTFTTVNLDVIDPSTYKYKRAITVFIVVTISIILQLSIILQNTEKIKFESP